MEMISPTEQIEFKNGKANLLMTLLKVKFNEIPEDYIKRIKNADSKTLNQWSKHLIFASSLEEIFKH